MSRVSSDDHLLPASVPPEPPTPELEPVSAPEGDLEPSPGRGSVLRGAGWNSLSQIAPLVINLALTPYVLHNLGPNAYGAAGAGVAAAAYGLFVVVNSLAAFMGTFDGGIGPSSQRFFAMYAGQGDLRRMTRLFTSLLVVMTAVSVVVFSTLFFAAPAIMTFFKAPPALLDDSVFLFRTMVVIIGLALIRGLFATVLYAQHTFSRTSIAIMLGHLVYTVGMIWAVASGAGLRGVAYTFIAQQLVGTLFIVPPALKFLEFEGPRFVTRAELKEFFSYAWKAQVSSVFEMVGLQGDTLIVARVVPTSVAAFGPGSQFAYQLRTLPAGSAQAPMQASIGRLVGERGARGALSGFESIQRNWVAFVVGWVAVGLPACYFGVTEWLHIGNLTGIVAAVLLFAHLFPMLAITPTLWCLTLGHPEVSMRYGIVNVILNLSLTLALIFPFGVVGSVIATALAQFLALVFLDVSARRTLGVPPTSPFRSIPLIPALVSLAASVAGTYAMSRVVELGWVPQGGLALIVCAVGALPAVLAYVAMTFGLDRARSEVLRRLGRA